MSTAASPLSAPKRNGSGLALGCAIPFGLVFAAIGLTAFWFVTARPLLRSISSAGWTAVPCEILSSELQVNDDSDGDTYRVAIRYRYEWPPATPDVERGAESTAVIGAPSPDRKVFESERYDFSEGSTNVGVKKMRAAVRDNPPGARRTCYVDPDDPASAVLHRGVPTSTWFGVFLLLFPLFGIGFIWAAWRARRKALAPDAPLSATGSIRERAQVRGGLASARGPVAAALRMPDASDPVEPGEVLLKPAAGRVATFAGIAFFAVFWNGITWFIFFQALRDFGRGGLGWFPVLFFVPFLAIGLFLAFLALQAFSRLFAPPVELRLDPSRLRLGARVPFTWRLGGRGVRKLTLRLVAREEASYRQGTNTRTDKSEFHRAVVFESTDILSLAEGRGELVLPADAAAPAFSAENNRIVWELAFEGEIPWRADVDDTFLLAVRGPETPLGLAATPEPREHRGGGFALWTVDRFAPGETLVFTLAREADAKPGPVTLRLGWFTEGKGTRDAAVQWSETLNAFPPGTDRSFEVRLPEYPWSFAGKLVAVEWRLELVDPAGEPLIAVPLIIAPGGAVVHLPALPPEPSAFQKRKARFRMGSNP